MRNRNKSKVKKFTNKMQAKLLLVFSVLIISMMGLIFRLIQLNHEDGERFEKKVLSQQTYTSTTIPYKRGSILDRNGTVLAVSEKVYNVILDVKHLLGDKEYILPTKKALLSSYEITEEAMSDIINNKAESRYTILLKGISYEDMLKFKALQEKDSNIQGVWFEEDYVRKYPYNSLASVVLGFTSNGNVGNWGIEQYYNNELNGTNGVEYGYIDTELKLEKTVKSATNGNTLVSTIDANVQGIVQKHINNFIEEFDAVDMGVIVMNPNNGEVYAMATKNEYDLNNPADLTSFYSEADIKAMNDKERVDALSKIWKNYTISHNYEPGSTFKPFTIAAGLEEAVIHSTDTFNCDGIEIVNGVKIKCNKKPPGHGVITLTEALMFSCNDALMEIGKKEGSKLLYDYETRFGLGKKTGIDLPGEESGLLKKAKETTPVDLAVISFGQTNTVTMVQMAAGFSSLVNGGYYYEPHLVKQVLNDSGAVVSNKEPVLVRNSVSEETSKFLRQALFETVDAGTAKTAKVSGYKIGGKTGTAQKQPREDKRYIVSFIGVVPTDKPEAVIYVVIDDPQKGPQTAAAATAVASKILSEILPFLGIYPTEEIDTSGNVVVPVMPTGKLNTEEKAENSETEKANTEDENADAENQEDKVNQTDNENQQANQNQAGNDEQPNSTENGETEKTDDDESANDEFNMDALPFEDEEEAPPTGD
ncbi:stage V sporulation protein D [Anaerocolumna cellulosilytica]|uniref:Stage V sporulation protein D n=1 Tax=Anaerocolumna cellulosilytica TaxID=433286 RepID=A0A6S6R777_9FIRM|nr:penicillin-binding transpeptidase domain-containing protein [Anaerocolumna cellulosilytica]MBB5197059.1 stage V sporulation protein D (sporulation-specific penicillin-binding protein) [Anaerocolumna cellulosilytica]BCJ95272.1 stage V sporulation protein D [Anaerocolumna cellulosilytica]